MAEILSNEDKKALQNMINEHKGNKCVFKFDLLYRATRDDLTNIAFHQRCDNKGPTVTVARNSAKFIFGGYTAVSWQSVEAKYQQDCCAFLFRLRQEGHGDIKSVKWPVNEGSAKAVYCAADYGPTFGGGHDLNVFSGSPAKEGVLWKTGSSSLGNTYANNDHGAPEFNGENFEIEEVEVFSVRESGLIKDGNPWRDDVEGWSDKIRALLMKELAEYVPFGHEDLKIPQTNILLVGQVGAGKSSIYNTINSAYKRRVTSKAAAGRAQQSLTTVFRTYNIRTSGSGKPLNFNLCDTMGLEESQGMDKADISLVLDGYVQDGYKFNATEGISRDSPKVSETATHASKMHCVAFIMDSTKVDILPSKILERLLAFKLAAVSRRLTVVVLLTKVDLLCPHVMEDLSNVFYSNTVLEAVDTIADKLGIPKYCVLPIKNYEAEGKVYEPVDILALTALRQILNFSDDFLEGELDIVQRNAKQQE